MAGRHGSGMPWMARRGHAGHPTQLPLRRAGIPGSMTNTRLSALWQGGPAQAIRSGCRSQKRRRNPLSGAGAGERGPGHGEVGWAGVFPLSLRPKSPLQDSSWLPQNTRVIENCAQRMDPLHCYVWICPRPWIASLRRKYNVIQLGNHAAIHPHISCVSCINGPAVSAPSIAQLWIPTRTAHLPAYLHVQYHTTGKTHIVLSNATKAMRASLSSGNISRAI